MKLKKSIKFFLILLFLTSSVPTISVWAFYSRIGSKLPGFQSLVNFKYPLIPKINSSSDPSISTSTYILIDNATNKTLLSKNVDQRIYPASITKLATALTALNIYPLDEVVTITDVYKEGKTMELVVDEKITVRSLVTALLVYSANDAAYNLAKHHRDGIPGFVKEMNLIAKKNGLKNTNFINYDGIHHPDHYSTVADLAQLGRLALKNPIVRDTVKNQKLEVTSVDGLIKHQLTSTNELLGIVPEIEGLKTGWTPEAGGCFLGLINLDGHLLISVVTQSQDRFKDTVEIIDWAKKSLSWSEYTYQ